MKIYKLPNGEITKSVTLYLNEWKNLYQPVAQALDCEIIGFDPGLHLIEKNAARGFQISTTIAMRIRDLTSANVECETHSVNSMANKVFVNDCYNVAIEALKYLAQNKRPSGGNDRFNSEHLYQIAHEMKVSIELTT